MGGVCEDIYSLICWCSAIPVLELKLEAALEQGQHQTLSLVIHLLLLHPLASGGFSPPQALAELMGLILPRAGVDLVLWGGPQLPPVRGIQQSLETTSGASRGGEACGSSSSLIFFDVQAT